MIKPRLYREDDLQKACVRWFDLQHPALAPLLHHSPNEGLLPAGAVQGAKRKAMGVRAVFPDLVLLVPSAPYGYLCVELKSVTGRLSGSQRDYRNLVRKAGGRYVVVRSVTDFIDEVTKYLQQQTTTTHKTQKAMTDKVTITISRTQYADTNIWGEVCTLGPREAYIDLVATAREEETPRTITMGGRHATIGRGQVGTSLRRLAQRWGWSCKRVRLFLLRLRRAGLIEVEHGRPITVVTVTGYNEMVAAAGTTKGTTNYLEPNDIQPFGAQPGAQPGAQGFQEETEGTTWETPIYVEPNDIQPFGAQPGAQEGTTEGTINDLIVKAIERVGAQPGAQHEKKKKKKESNKEIKKEEKESTTIPAGACAYTRAYVYDGDNERVWAVNLRSNRPFVRHTATSLHATEAEVCTALADFDNENIALDKRHINFADYRRHAFWWLRSRLLNKNKTNGTNNINNNPAYYCRPTREQEKARRDAEFAEFIARKLSGAGMS